MPNRKTVVRTNQIPHSIKAVPLKAITFEELWAAYPFGNPYDNPAYENQCAIRMSVAFHKLGIEMKSFSEKLIKPLSGQRSIGRILIDGKPTATRADELAAWLQLRPIAGLKAAQDLTGPDWEVRVKGRTGIIAFLRYWARDPSEQGDPSGGHIDLWNGRRLTVSSAGGLLSMMGRRLGIASAHIPGTTSGYSDLGNARCIQFWELK